MNYNSIWKSYNPTFVTEAQWEKTYRTGYGNRSWQEYTHDEVGYVHVYTCSRNPEFPHHLHLIEETIEQVCGYGKGCIYRIALAG